MYYILLLVDGGDEDEDVSDIEDQVDWFQSEIGKKFSKQCMILSY